MSTENGPEKVDAPVSTVSNVTMPEMPPGKILDSSNGSGTQDHTQMKIEEVPLAQNHIAELQNQEAEVRRQEEETALIQAGIMIKQKIRACRHQIFSAMQRLQVRAALITENNIEGY